MNQEIKDAIEQKNKRITKAINHRDKQIAYFNSVNSAISLLIPMLEEITTDEESIRKEIKKWRDWFYQEWQNWYVESYDLEDQEEKPL